jgi:DNA modification methylase
MERNTIICGDALEVAKTLPDESVNCIVTSPPYFGLRDYGEDGQIGLERSPQEYIEKLVALFAELRRALRSDGTCWLNLGDSHANMNRTTTTDQSVAKNSKRRRSNGDPYGELKEGKRVARESNTLGLKEKDLIGIPWRVAFALQTDGWWLRQDIVWSKPNGMPESVTDRPTMSHEYVFLLTKKAHYWYDSYAIREPSSKSSQDRAKYNGKETKRPKAQQGVDNGTFCGMPSMDKAYGQGRNKRSVWEVATQPFSGAHFAVFPEALIEPMILVGCPKQCCATCGAPYERVVEREPMVIKRSERREQMGDYGRTQSSGTMVEPARAVTLGFTPTCTCNANTKPGLVYDPFMGAGTTGLVAHRLGRDYLGSELNPEYVKIANERLYAPAPPKEKRQDAPKTMPMFGE